MLVGTVFLAPQAAQGGTVSGGFTILHTNDFHGRHVHFPVAPGSATSQTGDPGKDDAYEFERAGTVGGFAALATAVERIREERGRDAVILLDAGDSFGDDLLGNLTRGEAVIRLMSALGYDFAALGNHDFDYGLERTRELDELASFPMRAANVIEEENGKPVLGDPTAVLDAGGIRVGILALGYHNTHLTTSPDNVKGLRFTSGIEAAREYVPKLRERADVVVVLSHQGTSVDELLAEEVEGIDIIVGGHSHDDIVRHNDTWRVQSLADGAVLGEVNVKVENGRISEVKGANHVIWNDEYGPDPRLANLVEELRAPHRDELEAVIGTAAERIDRQYKSESPFDRLTGDILREETGTDIAFLPGIGYGISLQEGPITREDLYTLIPHPSKLVTLELSGEQVLTILEQSATNLSPGDPLKEVGGLVQTSGLSWTVDLSRPAGDRISDVSVGGEPLAPERHYRVATHSGMLAGTHGYETFGQGRAIEKTERKVVDIVEAHFGKVGTVQPPALGDIKLKKE